METTNKSLWLNAGAVAAAIGASLCCILPVAVAILGFGSAALGAELEPFRPYFMLLTAAFLGFAFYQAYKPRKCEPGEACAVPEDRRRHRIVLWIVAVLAVVLMAFPYYISLLF
ncbi:uncharacterized protein LOC114575020 [Exaiptasia diaphana]|uniref:Mercuric transport protein MerT n=1 Tax=Exaiptasia diaphana TaxID=2652724 RepID=A0A913YKD0_EXADI|nr:uncharacterized protein LOC114575020 [Exaiptasia diaphana]